MAQDSFASEGMGHLGPACQLQAEEWTAQGSMFKGSMIMLGCVAGSAVYVWNLGFEPGDYPALPLCTRLTRRKEVAAAAVKGQAHLGGGGKLVWLALGESWLSHIFLALA